VPYAQLCPFPFLSNLSFIPFSLLTAVRHSFPSFASSPPTAFPAPTLIRIAVTWELQQRNNVRGADMEEERAKVRPQITLPFPVCDVRPACLHVDFAVSALSLRTSLSHRQQVRKKLSKRSEKEKKKERRKEMERKGWNYQPQ
jgi:hypothetical protein